MHGYLWRRPSFIRPKYQTGISCGEVTAGGLHKPPLHPLALPYFHTSAHALLNIQAEPCAFCSIISVQMNRTTVVYYHKVYIAVIIIIGLSNSAAGGYLRRRQLRFEASVRLTAEKEGWFSKWVFAHSPAAVAAADVHTEQPASFTELIDPVLGLISSGAGS